MKANKNVIGFIVIMSCVHHVNVFGSGGNDDYVDLAKRVGATVGGPIVGKLAEKGTKVVVSAVTDPNFAANLEQQGRELAGKASEKAQEFQEDTGNMFHSYKTTFGSTTDPLIGATVATLKLQKRHEQAKDFKRQANSPYYPYAFASFISGASLFAMTPFVSRENTSTLLKGSGLFFATSFGCWYKSRSDIIALRKSLDKQFQRDE